ncbi:MAG: hypothetical protein AAF639_00015 [Chloroflexota bacterium]
MNSTTTPVKPSAQFDVYVRSISLTDGPATIQIDLEIAGVSFFSQVIYHSIPSWQALWARCCDVERHPQFQSHLLGALVAWECMRFLALGGERVVLCPGLHCNETVQQLWTYCFRHQLGEWRYLNQLQYETDSLPELIVSAESSGTQSAGKQPEAGTVTGKPQRVLLTNGGGKDTLAGMLLLTGADINFDLYEGYLPIGNNSLALQQQLLQRLKDAAAPSTTETHRVTVEDNFFSCPESVFDQMGVQAKHTKIDFAVGHTANYIGYFPVILYHGYTDVWFNIERSADNEMVHWAGDSINHQWCKSVDYQQKAREVFTEVTGLTWFHGFSSTLRGLYDMSIYSIVAQYPVQMQATHSCNYGKPWCNNCPKCCFCYLMMCAHFDESFAKVVVGSNTSLFTIPENRVHWESLLDPKQVAWECVPSHEECQVAGYICLQKGLNYPVLQEFVNLTQDDAEQLWQRYTDVDWTEIPEEVHTVLRDVLTQSPNLVCNERFGLPV